jgi:succinyl-diaminopimelate desuccinylase|tara:strand:- start:473 stop:1579 length:1107 start_codon:yes stop_codon:yes gene_type:complete
MAIYGKKDVKERIVALTRDLILIPSTVSRPVERLRCYEFIKNHLEALDQIKVREYESKGIPSLLATAEGINKPKILLCGHLDVIDHPDKASYHSVVKEGRIYGPGSGDMKGALAILLEVFRNIHSQKPDASLGIAITSDEESGGASGIGFLVARKGLSCKSAIIPDGGSLNEITVEEKGILHLKISSYGHPVHSARPWLGKNPIQELMGGIIKVQSYFDSLKTEGHWYPTCAVTIISTENKTINRIPSQAQAVLDIRFPPPFKVDSLTSKIKEILGKNYGIEKILGAGPTHLSPDPLYQKITEEVTGKKAVFIRDDGGSDARYLAPRGIPVMMSRPIVGNLHAEDEWVDIDSMVLLYEIYERYLLNKL